MNVMRRTRTALLLGGALMLAGACSAERALEPVTPTQAGFEGSPNGQACWGQASAVFARTGVMGQHASQQPTPRMGLRNLARALHDAGVLPDDTLQSLGVFVTEELGLSISACLDGGD